MELEEKLTVTWRITETTGRGSWPLWWSMAARHRYLSSPRKISLHTGTDGQKVKMISWFRRGPPLIWPMEKIAITVHCIPRMSKIQSKSLMHPSAVHWSALECTSQEGVWTFLASASWTVHQLCREEEWPRISLWRSHHSIAMKWAHKL